MFAQTQGRDETARIVKRMVYLAWTKSRHVGLGFLSDKGPEQDEDTIWKCVQNGGDNRNSHVQPSRTNPNRTEIRADYIHGRCMKPWIAHEVLADMQHAVIEADPPADGLDPAYQTWCRAFATYEDLFAAAVGALAESDRTGAKIATCARTSKS